MHRRRPAALLGLVGLLLGLLVLCAGPASSAGGGLDTSFGTSGSARFDFGGSGSFDAVEDLALQADGKVVAVGRTTAGAGILRLTIAGTLDSSFGSGGKVSTSAMTATGVAVQADGKLVVVGQNGSGAMVLARWTATGAADTSFGTGGSVTVAMSGGGQDVAVAGDGKLVVLAVDGGALVVLRFLADGTADTSFGTAGRATLSATPSGTSRIAVQADGKPVVTGVAGANGGVFRLTAAGAADATFGSAGAATTVNHDARAVAVQSSGKLVTAGDLGASDTKALVVRRNADGSLDTTFGTGGVAAFAVPGMSRATATGLASLSDGSVVVSGRTDDATRASTIFVARLTSNGVLDTGFATSGISQLATANGLATASAAAVAVDSGGRYVVGGSVLNDHASFTNDNDFLVARVLGVTTVTTTSSTTPQDVGAGGTVSTDGGAAPTAANPVVVAVTSPVAGQVSITKSAGTAPAGSKALGGATITAPASTASAPLLLQFDVDVSTLPDSLPLRTLAVTRDTTEAADCTSTTVAAPDPCVLSRSRTGDTVTIRVLSSHASAWTIQRPVLQRLFGDDRILSSIAISKASYADGKASAVVLSRSDDFADALAAIPLAVKKQAPLLLTGRQTLDDRVLAELTRVLPVGRTVYVLGGPSALSEDVVDRVQRWGYAVQRLGGDTRYDTAVVIATTGLGSPSIAVETTGQSFADALAAGAAAANVGGAVLLTAGRELPDATAAYVARATTRIAVGGPAAAADPGAAAIVGDDRYETAVLTAKVFFDDEVGVIGVASGASFADALAGGVHAALLGGPLLLLPPSGGLPTVVSIYLRDQAALPSAYVYGGTNALPADVAGQLQTALGG
jgi:uncharacterized delta-60 repeat protein